MQKGKKIAIIGSRGIPAEFGGFETFAEQLSVRLVEKGFDVTVFCEDTQNYIESSYKGVKLIYVKTPNIVGLRSVWFDIVNIVKTLKGYDVVYMLGYHAAFVFILPWMFKTNFWVNMDGLEWKRDKWSPFAKRYLKLNEWLAVIFAGKLVADAQAIADHLDRTYGVSDKTVMIPYGAFCIESELDKDPVLNMGLIPGEYYLVVCRLEPENHVKEVIEGYVKSNERRKLIIIGDDKSGSDYVKNLIHSADNRVEFIGTIYDQEKLMALRYYCKAYLHGHSVGGTNPSLLESMAAGNYVIAHDNVFNREVTGGFASYFKEALDLSGLINKHIDEEYSEDSKRCIKGRIQKIYNWKKITDIYESNFLG